MQQDIYNHHQECVILKTLIGPTNKKQNWNSYVYPFIGKQLRLYIVKTKFRVGRETIDWLIDWYLTPYRQYLSAISQPFNGSAKQSKNKYK